MKAFWNKIVPRLRSHASTVSDMSLLQFMRLGIHGWLGVNEGKHGTCVAVNALPTMLASPLSTTLQEAMLLDKSFRDNVIIFEAESY